MKWEYDDDVWMLRHEGSLDFHLNQKGKEGWELVMAYDWEDDNEKCRLIFKRPYKEPKD